MENFRIKRMLGLCFTILSISFGNCTDITIVTENAPPHNYEEGGAVLGVGTEVLKALYSELKMDPPVNWYLPLGPSL